MYESGYFDNNMTQIPNKRLQQQSSEIQFGSDRIMVL